MAEEKSGVAEGQTNIMSFRLSHGGRIIDSYSAGLVTIETVDQHFAALKRDIVVQRARYGHARALVDLQSSRVQTSDVAKRIEEHMMGLFTTGDRLALLLQSTLLGMQIKRLQIDFERRAFGSREEAVDWLLS